ncbi:MAG: ABC transporter permease [Synechococcaceae cyanobacterium SM2_3_2]|nr:ABC transporter permease [Synechococcaceae cyanobacterium SM2_3_2]
MAHSSFQRFLRTRQAAIGLPLVAGILVLVIWETSIKIFNIPQFILPAPTAIWSAFLEWSDVVAQHSWVTAQSTLLGFGIAVLLGVLLGFSIGYSRLAYTVLYPLLIGFNTIPKVALVPLLAIWFGVGMTPAVITAFTLAFFPIAVNVAVGLDTVEPEMQDVLRALGASQWEMFIKVGLPHSLPYLFASLKIAISSAFIGSVISETVASNSGVGYLIVSASSSFDVPLAFVGLLVLAAMGIVLYTFFASLERFVIRWSR